MIFISPLVSQIYGSAPKPQARQARTRMGRVLVWGWADLGWGPRTSAVSPGPCRAEKSPLPSVSGLLRNKALTGVRFGSPEPRSLQHLLPVRRGAKSREKEGRADPLGPRGRGGRGLPQRRAKEVTGMSSQSLNRQGISAVFRAQRQTQETGSPCLGLRYQLVGHETARMCKDKCPKGTHILVGREQTCK